MMHERWLILSLFHGTVLVLSLAALLLFFQKRQKKNEAETAHEGEERFRLMAEAIPQIVWTAIPGGGIDYCNQRFYDLT